jgi:hypothetical protein
MPVHDLQEQVQTILTKQRKGIGLTTAIIAVLLAIATMLGNSANTQKIVDETKTADWWAYVHSSDTNSRLYMANAQVAQHAGDEMVVKEFNQLAKDQKAISDDAILNAQRLEKDSALQARISHFCGLAELFLQLSIVVCSVSLLTDLLLFWYLSFASTAGGVIFVVLALMQR